MLNWKKRVISYLLLAALVCTAATDYPRSVYAEESIPVTKSTVTEEVSESADLAENTNAIETEDAIEVIDTLENDSMTEGTDAAENLGAAENSWLAENQAAVASREDDTLKLILHAGEYGYFEVYDSQTGKDRYGKERIEDSANGQLLGWRIYPPEKEVTAPDNMHFTGWYYDPDFTKQANYEDEMTGDTDLYARWAEAYVVTYHADENCGFTYYSDYDYVQAGFTSYEKVVEPGARLAAKEIRGLNFYGVYAIEGLYFDEARTVRADDYIDGISSDTDLYIKTMPCLDLYFLCGDKGYFSAVEEDGSIFYTRNKDVYLLQGETLEGKMPRPIPMEGSDLVFAGWYTDWELQQELTENMPVYENMVLNARWIYPYKVTAHTDEHSWFEDYSGEKYNEQVFMLDGYSSSIRIENPKTEDGYRVWGIYTDSSCTKELKDRFNYLPTRDIDVYVKTGPLFGDVLDKASSFYEPIYYAAENGITSGFDNNTFRPDDFCTRGQAVTFIWRAMGRSPKVPGVENSFTDIPLSGDFYQAILWAKSMGITTGITDTIFGTNNECTRGQIVTFLWRAAGKPEPASTETKLTDLNPSSPFYKAILWASQSGITTGFDDNTFRQDQKCTRGQIVTFLYRFLN